MGKLIPFPSRRKPPEPPTLWFCSSCGAERETRPGRLTPDRCECGGGVFQTIRPALGNGVPGLSGEYVWNPDGFFGVRLRP